MTTSNGPNYPRQPTIKRLFAMSGNRCAMPDCETRLIDSETGSVVGEMCHIKGEKPTSARHDKSQTNEERHGFDNLVLMCNTHHKVIDDNEDKFPVESLLEIKRNHEANTDPYSTNEKTADQFCNFVLDLRVEGNVESFAQSGGQTALVINNYHSGKTEGKVAQLNDKLALKARLRKELKKAAKEIDPEALRSHPPEKFKKRSVIIRSIDDVTYPECDDSPVGISNWFKLEVWDFYHNGLEFVGGVESVIVDSENNWMPCEGAFDESRFQEINVLRILQIPYQNIVEVDMDGDEYYPQPHFFCRFINNGEPYEGKRLVVANGYPWPLDPERRILSSDG